MPYLETQPTSVVAPQAPLRALLTRLRDCAIDEALLNDEDILGLFSEAYLEACQRSQCLKTLTTVAFAGSEAQLPADHHKTLRVYRQGWPLERLAGRNALRGTVYGYYEYGTTIGLAPAAPTSEDVWLLYARSPSPFATLDSLPDPGFPLEFVYTFLFYVRWFRFAHHGGAQRISQTGWEREQYDAGVSRLRTRARRFDQSRLHRFEGPMRRSTRRLHPAIDAG